MKLYYFKSKTGRLNFGDDLNPWMWEKLGFTFDDNGALFIGIGTLLNDSLPSTRKVVFGSGVGYGNAPAIVNDDWKIYCVRGPLSAKKLGVDGDLAVTDPAILLRNLISVEAEKKYDISYIPHIANENEGWKKLCNEIGVHYITPNSKVEIVLEEIKASKKIITEAMHGAIVADALRVPWLSVVSTSEILSFKWEDWCASMNLLYCPRKLIPIYGLPQSLMAIVRFKLKGLLVKHKLRFLIKSNLFQLSDEKIFNARLKTLNELLKQLKKDIKDGRLE